MAEQVVRVLNYQVEEGGITLGSYLRRRGYSSTLLTSLRQREGVRVNGQPHRMIDPLEAGDMIQVSLSDHPSDLVPNPHLSLPVLYEDEDVLVIDKPPDMLVHPAGKGFDDAVGNFFVARYPGLCFRPVGRLDRNTTGLVLAAKNQLAAIVLTNRVDKRYFALAEGRVEADAGLIDAPLQRVGGKIIRQQVAAEGKPSCTQFQVLERLEGLTLLSLTLLTGRTHQIRAHLAHVGHPLAGDALYGGSRERIGRQALHCGELSFSHPISGRLIRVGSPLPEDMARLTVGICSALFSN